MKDMNMTREIFEEAKSEKPYSILHWDLGKGYLTRMCEWAKRERKEKASSGNLNKFLNLTNIMKWKLQKDYVCIFLEATGLYFTKIEHGNFSRQYLTYLHFYQTVPYSEPLIRTLLI